MVKKIYLAVILVLLSGCTNKSQDMEEGEQKEYILTQLHDYQGLISIYRNKLGVNDNAADRYHLAELYNKIGDYASSDIYLQPLTGDDSDYQYSLLQVKNYLELGREDECEPLLNSLLKHDGSDGELWNLQGIMLAQQGKYHQSQASFEKARSFFYDEEAVINNLAMTAILQQDYTGAKNYLLPLYARKEHRKQTVYNLVYVLTKTNDDESARRIIIDQQLSPDNPDKLIRSLKQISPRNQYNLPATAVAKNKPTPALLHRLNLDSEPDITSVAPVTMSPKPVLGERIVNNNVDGRPVKYSDSGTSMKSKMISALTSAKTGKGERLALYSDYPVNYMILPQNNNNQIRVELFNARPSEALYISQLNVIKKRPGINNIEFLEGSHNSTILEITTSESITDKNIFRARGNKKLKEKILIDLNYG